MTLALRQIRHTPLRMDGSGAPTVASGYYVYKPSKPYDDGTGRVERIGMQVNIDGASVIKDIPVTPADFSWAWEVTGHLIGQDKDTLEYVRVPTGSYATVLDFEDLVRVDPSTLGPTTSDQTALQALTVRVAAIEAGGGGGGGGAVASVAGKTGVVTLVAADLTNATSSGLSVVTGSAAAGLSALGGIAVSQRSVPGGVAGLDVDGDVINSAGAKVAGGSGVNEIALDTDGTPYFVLSGGIPPGSGAGGLLIASDISDSTPIGQLLIRAADQLAARTAIGAGTASTAANVGLGNVNNTSDAAKPLSDAAVTALAGKVSTTNLVLSATRPASAALGTVWIQAATSDTAVPSTPTLATPTSTSTSVTLTWSAATDVGSGVAGYDVYRAGTKLNGAPVTATTYTETGLTPSTSYGPYTVRARDNAGNVSGDSNSQTISTGTTGDVTAPTVPTGVGATSGNAQATVSWTASTDAVGVTGYRIYVNNVANTTSASSPKVVTGLTNGTTYSITVTAFDAAGNESAKSTAASVTPAAPADTTAPSTPTGVSATPGNSQINITWTASTDAVGVTGYKVYLNNVYTATASGTTYLATGLTNGTSYLIRISAIDAAGNESAQSTGINSTPTGSAGAAFTDAFTRADVSATTVGSTAIGGGWTVGSGQWAIASNKLKVLNNATTGVLGNTANLLTTNDQYMQFTYQGGAPTSGEILATLRTDSTAANFLAGRVIPVPASGNTQVGLQSCVAGAVTGIGSLVTLPASIAIGDLVRFEVNGTSMILKINGTTVASGTTSNVPTGTGAGFRAKTAINLLVDDAAWGDL